VASHALGGRTAWASRGCPEEKATSFRGHSKPRPTARMRFTAASSRICWTNQITNELRGPERGGEETGVPRILGACLQSRRPKKPIGRWLSMSNRWASTEGKNAHRKLCWIPMGFGCRPMAIGVAVTMGRWLTEPLLAVLFLCCTSCRPSRCTGVRQLHQPQTRHSLALSPVD